jgi:DNA-directed RNA polymerase specialized sigma24 family protein
VSSDSPDDFDVGRLTRAMKRGDEAAWRRFHDFYYEDLRRVALSRGVADSEVADVVQRSYLRILKHVKPFHSESDFRAWCLCLLRSEVVDTSRRNGRRQSMVERFKEWAGDKSVEWLGSDPLEGMPMAERSLLERHYVEGWSQAELAAEAGVSVKAIESKMARLRQRARTFVEKSEFEEP